MIGSLRSPQAQLDFADWLARHQQDDREQKIREVAENYAKNHHDLYGHPGGSAQVVWANPSLSSYTALGTAGWVHPSGPKPVAEFTSITIDVHPHVQGFARQLIAEAQIREQLDEIDEPYDD